jgi:hypothetical protein
VHIAGIPSPYPFAGLLAYFQEHRLRVLGAPSPLQGEVRPPEISPAAVRAIVPLRGAGQRPFIAGPLPPIAGSVLTAAGESQGRRRYRLSRSEQAQGFQPAPAS